MLITNKDTGSSFNLSPKETADFFYTKNAKGKYINSRQDYTIKDNKKEISDIKFFLAIIGLLALSYASFYLFLQFNY